VEEKIMKNKIFAIIITLSIVLSTVVIFSNNKGVASSGSGGGNGDFDELGINLTYIKLIAENLSNIVKDDSIYPQGTIVKGRFYGSNGEKFASTYLAGKMANLGLYDPCLDSEDPYLEQIQNRESKIDLHLPSLNLTEDIEILDYGIIINNGSSQNLTDFYVRPMWNWRLFRIIIEYWKEKGIVQNNTEGVELLESTLKINTSIFPRYNWIFNDSWLTKNIKYENLSLLERPDNSTWFEKFIKSEYTNITSNESIVDYASFMDYVLPAFQNYYNFTFGELNVSYAKEKLYWYEDQWYDDSRCGQNFLLIGEDLSFNPNATNRTSFYLYIIEELLPNHPWFAGVSDFIEQGKVQIEHMLWNLSCCHYRGLLLYNFDNHTYNMQLGVSDPSHNLYINGSIGKPIYEDYDNYTVTFWINQNWTEDIESYNVIGQINGTDPNKTVIISCLYDSWWNQGTGDSAIGMAIVLGIAKYFQDHNITPRYNLKFIGFAGEEAGLRGAYHYEAKHSDENVIMVIDMNQVGFDHPGPPLVLNLINNNNLLNSTYWAIANVTEYEKRIGDNTTKLNVTDNLIVSDYTPFNQNRTLDTICFLKDLSWIYHHRSGENHTKGDTMDYYNETDVKLTTELVWNITKYFCVNPNCSAESVTFTPIDTDDLDEWNDSIRVNFTAITILPHDRLIANATLRYKNGSAIQNISILDFTVNSTGKNISIIVTLPSDKPLETYYLRLDLLNSTGCINYTLNPNGDYANQTNTSGNFSLYPYNYNLYVPNINNISFSPDTVGYGFNISISADVKPNLGGDISNVSVNITYPDNTLHNFEMNNTVNDTYEYIFNDTWQYGQYDFYIWAKDVNGNVSSSKMFNFDVDVDVDMSICTIKDEYNDSEIVNLTDPPGNPYRVEYEFLDDGKVLHIWNRFDSYYFNTSNGVQFTNHKDDYWSHNVLMLGYYNNDVWNLIYRSDNLSGFNKNIKSDNLTYVNATLWKDLTYEGYEFRLAIRYYLGVDDTELTVIPYIKNLDDEDIPYILGFAWELKDIQVDMTPEYDYIEIDGTSYFLNQTLDESYTNLDNPCYYIKEDKTVNTFESLYLRWDGDLNYKVKVESREDQYNAPVTLGIKIGTLNVDQVKYTSLFWHDASEITYYFDGYNASVAWSTNPSYMVDGNESIYASTSMPGPNAVEKCINNTCDGSYLGNISKVELRCKAYCSNIPVVGMNLTPVFNGNSPGSQYTYNATSGPSGNWSQWFDITSGLPSAQWNWYNVKNLDCDVLAPDLRDSFTLYCSKVEVRVTYNPKEPSGITNPYPPDGSIGISITPTLSINVSDADGDNMTITWYSNSSGSWQIFGTNFTTENGTFYQVFSNATENGKWWYWNVSVDDGEVVNSSDIFSFYTGYESKIHNTGSTNISGYLTINVEFYNETLEEWIEELNVIDESYVVINSSEKLGLDTIFNPEKVNTSSFTHGNGTYRVYAMLTDPYKNILFGGNPISSEDDIEAWYEFTVTYD
jgi:hypothetical protein